MGLEADEEVVDDVTVFVSSLTLITSGMLSIVFVVSLVSMWLALIIIFNRELVNSSYIPGLKGSLIIYSFLSTFIFF